MNWQTRKLGELVDDGIVQLTRGKVISKKDIAAHPGTYPIYSSAKDNNGMFGRYGKFMFDEPLITWSVDGGGRLFFRPKHKFSVTNVGGILRIKKPEVLDYQYLLYVLSLKHSEIRFDWVRKAHPSVIRELYKDIPLPSLSEQKRIVKKLDEVFEEVAKAKEAAEKNLQNAKELFESYLQSAFADPKWKNKKLGDIAEHSLGKMLDKAKNKGELQPYLRNLNVRWFEFDLSDVQEMRFETKELEKYTASKGDILICEGGYPGRAAIWMGDKPIYFQKAIHRVRFPSLFESKWFLYYLYLSHKTGGLKKYLTGTGILHFTGESLDSFILPTAPLSEQKAIVKKLDALSTETKKLEKIYEQKIADLEELKKSVLRRVFTGKL